MSEILEKKKMSDLFGNEIGAAARCERCGAACKVTGPQNSKAKMLRRSKEPKGLCVNCAVHDWLRNTYPVNMLMAQSGPKALAFPHVQKQFEEIMRVGMADAVPDEINWDSIVENWDLPFKNKIKSGPMNPCSQGQLDEIAAGERQGFNKDFSPQKPDPLHGKTTITSFEELNLLEPGLGDKLRQSLK